jgi:hypothetical protein
MSSNRLTKHHAHRAMASAKLRGSLNVTANVRERTPRLRTGQAPGHRVMEVRGV